MAQWTTHASTQHEQISITDSAVCLRNSTGPRAQSSNCGVPSCCIAISRRQTSSSKDASRCDECRASVGKVILSNQPHSIAFYSSHHQGLPVKYAAVPFGSTFSKQEIACIATYQVRQREKKHIGPIYHTAMSVLWHIWFWQLWRTVCPSCHTPAQKYIWC